MATCDPPRASSASETCGPRGHTGAPRPNRRAPTAPSPARCEPQPPPCACAKPARRVAPGGAPATWSAAAPARPRRPGRGRGPDASCACAAGPAGGPRALAAAGHARPSGGPRPFGGRFFSTRSETGFVHGSHEGIATTHACRRKPCLATEDSCAGPPWCQRRCPLAVNPRHGCSPGGVMVSA